jgi:hypothetical protein
VCLIVVPPENRMVTPKFVMLGLISDDARRVAVFGRRLQAKGTASVSMHAERRFDRFYDRQQSETPFHESCFGACGEMVAI